MSFFQEWVDGDSSDTDLRELVVTVISLFMYALSSTFGYGLYLGIMHLLRFGCIITVYSPKVCRKNIYLQQICHFGKNLVFHLV